MTKTRRPHPNRNISGIIPHRYQAPDTHGDTVPISGRVPPDLKDWLKSLPGNQSYHVRQALLLYQSSYDPTQSK
jgi:hypothetical protein